MTGANAEPLTAVRYTYGVAEDTDTLSASKPPPPTVGGGGEPQAGEVSLPDADAVAGGFVEPFLPGAGVPEGLVTPETQRVHKVGASSTSGYRV